MSRLAGSTWTHSLYRAMQASFNSPARKIAWATVSTIALVLGLVTQLSGMFSHEAPITRDAKALSVVNAIEFQSTFDLFPENPSGDRPSKMIRWRAVYTVTNRGDRTILLKDLKLSLPRDYDQADDPVQLRRTATSATMTVYNGREDWISVHNLKKSSDLDDARYARALDRPIALQAGHTYIIEYVQQFILQVGGTAAHFDSDKALADILGQYFELTREKHESFQCGAVEIPTTIITADGTLHRTLAYEILFAGCGLDVPPVTAGAEDVSLGDG